MHDQTSKRLTREYLHLAANRSIQGAAEDRGSLAALDRELQELSSTDMRQAALQVTARAVADQNNSNRNSRPGV